LHKFDAWLVCPTKFLCEILSSSTPAGKSYLNRKHKSTGWLGHCREMGRSNGSKPPPKDKHSYLLTLRIKFITEPPTPAMVGDRTSLGGWWECLFTRHFSLLNPSLRLKTRDTVCGRKTLSKPGRTARTLRPSGYGVFTHQRDQSLCLRTPNLNLHLVRKGMEGPTYEMYIKERLSGHPSRSNG